MVAIKPELSCEDFQKAVGEYLIRHKSILDALSKFQEANARANRAIVKAVTGCGCVEIQATKPDIPADISYWEIKDYIDSHLHGELCEECRDVIKTELGRNLFYLTALCHILNLDLGEIMEEERRRLTTLGIFNLT